MSKKLNELPAAQSLTGTEIFYAVQDTTDVFVTANQIARVTSSQLEKIDDMSASIDAAARNVLMASLTSTRTLTLPVASLCSPGQGIYIQDGSGQCSLDNKIIVATAGSDLLNGVGSYQLAMPYAGMYFMTDGSSNWFANGLNPSALPSSLPAKAGVWFNSGGSVCVA